MNMIIYGSNYGNSKKYAEELARKINWEVKSYTEVKNINDYEDIIYIGSLYAGGVLGLKKTFAKLNNDDRKIIIVTVGAADPTAKENTDHIKACIKNQVAEFVYEKANIFHLRGGLDYSKLNFMHKSMMGLLYKKVSKIPEDQRTVEIQGLIETYNKVVDFVDFETLDPIIKEVLSYSNLNIF